MSNDKDIEANQLTIEQLFNMPGEYFKIPDYQRRYSWKEEQIEEFYDDLNSLGNNEEHFLGSIVTIARKHNTGFNKIELVDGQQRITTIMVILKVLEIYFKKQNTESSNNISEVIIDDYIHATDRKKKRTKKLVLGKLDRDDYNLIVSDKKVMKEKIDNINLFNCYDYFISEFKNKSFDELEILYDKLLTRLIIVKIDAVDEKSAFRLFETLNDRGLDLSATDLMKNYLLRKISEDNKNDINDIKKLWEEIIINLKDYDKIRFFRHYIMSSKKPVVRGKITNRKLYDKFKNVLNKKIPNLKSDFKIKDYIEDIREKSYLYDLICKGNISELSYIDSQYVSRINQKLKNLISINILPVRILLLSALDAIDTREFKVREFDELLKLTEIFLTRRIIGNLNANELDGIFNKIAIEAFEKDNALEFIKNLYIKNDVKSSIFIEQFKNKDFKNNDFTKYILDVLEYEIYTPTSGEGKESKQRTEVHIEHIAPRRSFSAKKYTTWEKYLDMNEEEFELYKSKLGNLTLFEKRLNQEASINPFLQKKNKYINSDFYMTRELKDFSDWKKEDICKRTNDLAKHSVEVWSF